MSQLALLAKQTCIIPPPDIRTPQLQYILWTLYYYYHTVPFTLRFILELSCQLQQKFDQCPQVTRLRVILDCKKKIMHKDTFIRPKCSLSWTYLATEQEARTTPPPTTMQLQNWTLEEACSALETLNTLFSFANNYRNGILIREHYLGVIYRLN